MHITYYMLSQEKYKQHSTLYSTALRLRRICDSDEIFKHRSEEYKNYLIVRAYHPGLVNKQFQKVEMTSRHNVERKIQKEKW